MTAEDFEKNIAPFFWVEHSDSVSVCLYVGNYLHDVFETRAEEGFEGNGYDWGSLAQVFLEEKCPELLEKVQFDPEAGMFCAYSKDAEALKTFICGFKAACEDKTLILDLFRRAQLD